jgi:uncharacterized RDD family membrane protein YckC
VVTASVRAQAPAAYAGLATRMLAFAADAIVIDVVAWLVGGIVAVAVSAFDPSDAVQSVLVTGGAVAGAIWTVAYFVGFWSTSGQTPGDRLMRIRVQDVTTAEVIPVHRAIGRFAGLVLSVVLLFAGVLWMLVDRRRRGLHDHLAGTAVTYLGTSTARRAAR